MARVYDNAMIIAYTIIAGLAIMLASLTGAFFIGRSTGAWMKKNLKYLVTLSAGVFVAIIYGLLSEVIGHSETPWYSILGWIALGVVVVEVLSRLIPKAHHHHGDHDHDHAHGKLEARRMLLGDAMHNIADGLLLVPAFIADIRLGIFTAFAIFAHELVQEISEFFVLKEAGYTNRQALLRNFIVSGTIFIGVAASLLVTSIEVLEIPLLCFAAGGFIYIVLRDLLPHTASSIRKEKSSAIKHIAIGLVGILVMMLVSRAIPHEHPEEEHHEPEGEHLLGIGEEI